MVQSKLMKAVVFGAALLMPAINATTYKTVDPKNKKNIYETLKIVGEYEKGKTLDMVEGKWLVTEAVGLEYVGMQGYEKVDGQDKYRTKDQKHNPDDNLYSLEELLGKFGVTTKGRPAEEGPKRLKGKNKAFIALAGLVGAGMAGTAGGFAHEALTHINAENTNKEVFTMFGNADLGNLIAGLIMGGVALGLAFVVVAIAHLAAHGQAQHNMKWFQFWMFMLTFVGSGSIMLGLNFMEQNAADAGTAISNALFFNGTVNGTSHAEYFSGIALWGSVVILLVMVLVVTLFARKKSCFKVRA